MSSSSTLNGGGAATSSSSSVSAVGAGGETDPTNRKTLKSGKHHYSDTNGSNAANSNNNSENGESIGFEVDAQAEMMLKSSRFSAGQRDILRLIGQHLRLLGLEKTTETLIRESGCLLEHPTASNFCQLVMRGSWDEAEATLERLKSIMGQSQSDITVSQLFRGF